MKPYARPLNFAGANSETYTIVKVMTIPLPKHITSLAKYNGPKAVVTIMMVMETIKRMTLKRILHRRPRTKLSGLVAKEAMNALRSMKELMIC